jgi:phospholipase/carboxylesterase
LSEPELLPCVEVEARGGAAKGSVLWLHGLGASGHDFEDVVPMLDQPQVRFVFPHAPRRPVSVNMGLIMPAWYDIRALGGARGEDDERGIRESAQLVENLLSREKARGVPAGRIVLAGFSQGGALALFAGMRHQETLAGVMVLSAYELLPATREAEAAPANRSTPLLVCHGTDDPMVPLEGGRQAFAAWDHPERLAEFHEFPMAHAVCLEEIELIRRWLAERFATGD